MEAGLHEHLCHIVVEIVAYDDADKVNPLVLRQGRLRLRHFPVAPVHAARIEKEVLTRKPRHFRIGRETTRDQLDLAVEVGGHAVDLPDEGAAATADHAHSKLSVHGADRSDLR